MVLSQDGIFSRAEKATDKYGQAKARETLELALGEAQMQKYEQGLTDEQLDNKINEIGELLPKEKPDPNLQNAIVDGHIFEIDRSVPKIVDYIGPADGVVITAQITQNGNWQNPVATVKGTIKTYSGGNITESTATVVSGNANVASFPTNGGDYIIENITEDTDIKITAEDNKDKSNEKVIKVRLVRDNTPPTLSDASVRTILMEIKISVKAIDNESGVQKINYIVSPDTIKDGKTTGTLTSGQELEIEATAVGDYTVTFTATDNAGNTTDPGIIMPPVTAKDMLSLADLKKITPENYIDYIGKKVDYNPTGGGVWRVFYVEDSNNKFKDGVGTIYLKRDYDSSKTQALSSGMTVNGLAMMIKLNPAWGEYEKNGVKNKNKIATDSFLNNEKAVAGLCDTDNWTIYTTGDPNIATEGLTVNYAIGAAPIEMWVKAQNTYRGKTGIIGDIIGCDIKNDNGYGYRINNGTSLVDLQYLTFDTSKDESKVLYDKIYQWVASPSSNDYTTNYVCGVHSEGVSNNHYGSEFGVTPVVSIRL